MSLSQVSSSRRASPAWRAWRSRQDWRRWTLWLAVILLTASGLALVVGGAIRWQDCFTVAPWDCPLRSDVYSVLPNDHSGQWVGSPGAGPPIAAGHLLLAAALVLVACAALSRAGKVIVCWWALGVLLMAWHYAAADGDPFSTFEQLVVIPVWTGGPQILLLIFMLMVPPPGELLPKDHVLWLTLAGVASAHSLWGYVLLITVSDSWDDGTFDYLFPGVVQVAAALLLAWWLGASKVEQRSVG